MSEKTKIKMNLQICPLPIIAHAYRFHANFFKFNILTFQV